ncbi:MAG: hypothetical protein IRZ26_08430 [Clostridia bacterium]|nr:hypothetical protein [Clostridia bacterium]MCL6521701.1 hypothetical protein [Bacillota bacterium]
MSPDQIAQVVQGVVMGAGEQFLEGTLAAALPVLWLLVLALQLARPYMLQMLQKFSLRMAADLWWVLYVLVRDLISVVTLVLSFMFFFPDVVEGNALPLTGSLATVALFASLVVKLTSDVDEDPVAFRRVTWLVAAGSLLYLVPTFLGVQASSFRGVGPLAAWLTTSGNPGVALVLTYVSLVLMVVLGAWAAAYSLRTPGARARALRG